MNSMHEWRELVQKKEAWLIMLLCVVSFGTFRNFPFEAAVFLAEAPLLLMLSVFAVVYFIRRFHKRRHLNALEWIILLLAVMPLYSAVNAWMCFGQPVWYGLAAERRWLRIFIVLLFYVLISEKRISWDDVVRIFLIVAGIHVVVHVLGYVLVQALYDKPWTSELFSRSPVRGLRFRTEEYFLIWLLFYGMTQLCVHLFRKTRLWFIPVVCITGYLAFVAKSRSQTILVLLVIVLIIVTLLRGRWRHVAYSVVGVSLLSAIIFFSFKPEPLRNTARGFERIFQTLQVVQGNDDLPTRYEIRQRGLDVSTVSRLQQIQTAREQLRDHPARWILGFGRLSLRWKGGFNGELGYFYPADIGWLGILFLYGLIGFCITHLPYILAARSWRRMKAVDRDVFSYSLWFLLVYVFLFSMVNGMTVWKPAFVMLPAMLLHVRDWISGSREPALPGKES